MYRYCLFDLDGTLSDPKVGICTSVQYALSKMGIEAPDIDELEPFIGPPLRDSFKEYYNMSDEEAEQAITFYRERFSTVGKFENELYDGISELLSDLKKKGRVVAIASSKPTVFVRDILEHFEIDKYFDVVVGSELDGTRDTKEEVLQETLRQMFPDTEIEYDEVVMIGDRKFDIEAAHQLGVHNIAVSYGYGSREELEEAGADRICNTVVGLRTTLLPIMGQQSSYVQVQKKQEEAEQNSQDATKDWKTAGKEAGKQSFANLWGYIGPFLVYTLLSQIYHYILAMAYSLIAVNAYEGDISNLQYSYTISSCIWMGSYVLACASVIKPFIRCYKRELTLRKEAGDKQLFNFEWLALGGIVFCFELGTSLWIHSIGALSANRSYALSIANRSEIPLLLGMFLFAVVLPFTEQYIMTEICFSKAEGFMQGSMPMVLTIMMFVLHSSELGPFGILGSVFALWAYKRIRNIWITTGFLVAGKAVAYLAEINSDIGAKLYGPVIYKILMGLAIVGFGAIVVLENMKKNKEAV